MANTGVFRGAVEVGRQGDVHVVQPVLASLHPPGRSLSGPAQNVPEKDGPRSDLLCAAHAKGNKGHVDPFEQRLRRKTAKDEGLSRVTGRAGQKQAPTAHSPTCSKSITCCWTRGSLSPGISRRPTTTILLTAAAGEATSASNTAWPTLPVAPMTAVAAMFVPVSMGVNIVVNSTKSYYMQ